MTTQKLNLLLICIETRRAWLRNAMLADPEKDPVRYFNKMQDWLGEAEELTKVHDEIQREVIK